MAFAPNIEDEDLKKKLLLDTLHREFEEFGFARQAERDAALWYCTLTSNTNNPDEYNRIQILRRVFTILKFGGLMYRTDKNENIWNWYYDSNLSICSALSHGSRILIQLPKEEADPTKKRKRSFRHMVHGQFEQEHEFWCWLLTGDPDGDLSDVISTEIEGDKSLQENKCVFRRLASTHGIKKHNADGEVISINGVERRKRVYEVKKKIGLSLRDTKIGGSKKRKYNKHKHWGLNLAIGGAGNESFGIKMESVSSNGSNGHMYFHYLAPTTERYGALMIGVEGSEFRKTAQSGNAHSIKGTSNRLSATLGFKWSEIKALGSDGMGGGVPDKIDSLFIDLTPGWTYLMEKESEWSDEFVNETSNKFISSEYIFT
ncbi:arsA2 [Acrasis kona]|uniref:ArsA2 n=1 Tax=Acrasis kona TaxID=1008807 RepID=A0AAW2Z6P1_9EUKA